MEKSHSHVFLTRVFFFLNDLALNSLQLEASDERRRFEGGPELQKKSNRAADDSNVVHLFQKSTQKNVFERITAGIPVRYPRIPVAYSAALIILSTILDSSDLFFFFFIYFIFNFLLFTRFGNRADRPLIRLPT